MADAVVPSLEHFALVTLSASLWNHDIRAVMGSHSQSIEEHKKWYRANNRVKEQIPLLLLPELLRKKLLNFITPMGKELHNWIKFHKYNSYFDIDLPNEFCWTPQGTIDRTKTAEAIIRNENLNIVKRYKLACVYCLKNDILRLWKKVPVYHKQFFYHAKGRAPAFSDWKDLVIIMTYDIKGEVQRLHRVARNRANCSVYEYAFKQAVISGNAVAAAYFLPGYGERKREEFLFLSTEQLIEKYSSTSWSDMDLYTENCSDMLCFLLFQMIKPNRIEVIKHHYISLFDCLLRWPWGNCFMKVAEHSWEFFSDNVIIFKEILKQIFVYVVHDSKNYDYLELLREFWLQSPNACKNYYVMSTPFLGKLFPIFLELDDIESVKLFLKDTLNIDKENSSLVDCGILICESAIRGNRFELFKYYVQECLSLKQSLIQFKSQLESRNNNSNEKEENKFFEYLNGLIQTNEGRRKSAMNGDCSSSKKICSEVINVNDKR